MFHSDKIVLQGFARSIIRRKARLIARCGGFNANDQRDIEQELLLRRRRGCRCLPRTTRHFCWFRTKHINGARPRFVLLQQEIELETEVAESEV